uniref:Uncharacterized protein n=1 Tax=uncultured marine virus TaxID=186617 RepID=A0A0F7L8V3_9VIRU|nr:hypothetical protein [uncultured marine virus]
MSIMIQTMGILRYLWQSLSLITMQTCQLNMCWPQRVECLWGVSIRVIHLHRTHEQTRQHLVLETGLI